MISFLLSCLLYKLPKMTFTEQEIDSYERFLQKLKSEVEPLYNLSYPKYKFLSYLATLDEYVFHGSNTINIEQFEPRQQTLFNNKVVKAIFASSEPSWSLFYAVLDRHKVVGNFRNGCLVYKEHSFVYYSITNETAPLIPWTSGMIYILPKSSFQRADHNKVYFDEWISYDPVKPLFKLPIEVEDFYLINKVAQHHMNESIYQTWLNYKLRIKKLAK